MLLVLLAREKQDWVRRPSPFITRLGRETAEETYAGSRN